jgi:hypothetical protein
MAEAGTLDVIGRELAELLSPLTTMKEVRQIKQLMHQLGFELPPGVEDIGFAVLDVTALVDAIRALAEASPEDLEDELTAAGIYAELLIAGADLIQRVIQLANDLPSALAGTGNYLAATDLQNQLVPRLLDFLITRYVEKNVPELAATLRLLGLFDEHRFDADPAHYQPAHVRARVHYERVPMLFSDPLGLASEVYGWNTPSFDGRKFLGNVARFVNAFGAQARIRDMPRSVEERLSGGPVPTAELDPVPQLIVGRRRATAFGTWDFGTNLYVLRPTSPGASNAGIGVLPWLRGDIDVAIPLPGAGSLLSLLVESTIPISAGVSLRVRPDEPIEAEANLFEGFTNGISGGRVGVGVAIGRGLTEPIPIFSIPPGVRFEIGEGHVLVGGEKGPGGAFDFFFEVGLERAKLSIGTQGSDGFLSSIIPMEAMEFEFDFLLGYSPNRGVYFDGSASLETTIALDLELGPLSLEKLHLGLALDSGALKLETSITGGATVGPLAVTVERIGVETELRFTGGNLGPVDLRPPRFRPPNGLGIVIDAGPITGGGFLSLDYEKGRYAGILEISMFEISVTAIGLLDTKHEDGSDLPPPGFSFMLIVAVEFSPIQLGYGFTLNGVGGLAGIHRTFNTEALQSGLRSGALDSIMFPEDPVRNAPEIISNLQSIFPVQADRFVFGPMAIIGWGTPTLFRGELGIILELPAPIVIAILGQLSVDLPDPEAAIVRIRLDVLGIIDFGRKLFSIDAALRDSYVLAFSIYGEMALRVSWADPPSFALSIGGLNPHFPPPPGFPSLRRLGISLGAGDNPRISVEAYLAITSNSLQFGAMAELYAAAGEFSVRGWVGFDALIIFSPFSFRFDFDLGFSLSLGSKRIAGIAVQGALTGPNPFHVWGEASITILFFDVSVSFDATFGDEKPEELPQRDPWPELSAAIADARNWSASLPAGVYAAVTTRTPAGEDVPPLLHPMGTATLRQKVVPFNRELERFGEAAIQGARRFDIAEVRVGDESTSAWTPVEDYFAPGAIENLSPTEKLSRDSFEKMVAGIAAGSSHVEPTLSSGVRAKLEYETKIIDSPWDSRPAPFFMLARATQLATLGVGAKAKSLLSHTGRAQYADGPAVARKVGLDDETYVIASVADLSERADLGRVRSRSEAYQRLEAHLSANPKDRGRLQVVPLHEAA